MGCCPVYGTSGCHFFCCFESFVDLTEYMLLVLLNVSRTRCNIFPFPVIWCYSCSSAVLDEKLCSRVNGCKKLLSRSAMCATYIAIQIQDSLFNEGDVITPKSYLTYGLYNGTKYMYRKQWPISNIRLTTRETKT